MRHQSIEINNLGISDQEYIDSINLEKIYSLMKRNHLRCFYCHQTPAYIHMKTFDFLCAFHASEAKHTKKINEERFTSTEVNKILKRYNEEKISDGYKLESLQFTPKDVWPVVKRKSYKEAFHSQMNPKSASKSCQKKDRNPHFSSESGAYSSDDSFYSFNKRRDHRKTIYQNSNVRFHTNETSLKNSKNFDDREISTQPTLLSRGPLTRNVSTNNHSSNVCSDISCSRWIDPPTPSCYNTNSSISNHVPFYQKEVPASMKNSDSFKPNNICIQWTQKKTMGSNPFSQNLEHVQMSTHDSPLNDCEQAYSCHKGNPFDTHQCTPMCSNSTAAMQVPCMNHCHDATPFVMKQKNTCKTNFTNFMDTSRNLTGNTFQPHITTTNVKMKEWWEV